MNGRYGNWAKIKKGSKDGWWYLSNDNDMDCWYFEDVCSFVKKNKKSG